MRANGLQRRIRIVFVSATSFARTEIDSRVFFNQDAACDDTWRSAAHYYTSLDLSWDAPLNKMGVELELLTDVDMHFFSSREECVVGSRWLASFMQWPTTQW